MFVRENAIIVNKSIWDGVTLKSVISGFILAIIMCAANSYLTLKAGVIEEGPIIAALIFTGIFFAMKQKVTTTEYAGRVCQARW